MVNLARSSKVIQIDDLDKTKFVEIAISRLTLPSQEVYIDEINAGTHYLQACGTAILNEEVVRALKATVDTGDASEEHF